MINFKEIHAEGFGSVVDPMVFNLNQPGLNIIRGKVGSGKTTIPSTLTWCLFGQSLKEKATIETWPELRTKDYKGTKAEVHFEKDGDEYKVIRCLNYKGKLIINGKKLQGGNKLIVYKNDEMVSKDRNKKQVEDTIRKIIGYSFDLFKNSVVFGQRVKRIIEESGPDKKKIFDEGFEISFIEEAREREKKNRDKLVEGKMEIDNRLDNTIDKIESLTEQLTDALEYEKTFQKDKKALLKELGSKHRSYQELLKELSGSKMGKAPNVNKAQKQLKEAKAQLEENRSKQKEKEELYRQKLNLEDKWNDIPTKFDKCPKCGSKDHTKKLKAKAKKEKHNITHQLRHIGEKIEGFGVIENKALMLKIENYQYKITKHKEILDKAHKNKAKITKLQKKVKKTESKIEKLVSKKLKVKSTKFQRKIVKLEKQCKAQKKQVKLINKDIEIKDWLIKDPLSNNGLKAYMFDSMLNELNDKLMDYSNILGFEVAFGIDLDSSRKDFYQAIEKDGIIIAYEDLSGGQKQLVDTTVALAIHDVISKLRPTNIVFMDEPFESLDEENVEIIEEIIENKSKGKSLFLITHKKTFNPLQANVISFKLTENKQTKFH